MGAFTSRQNAAVEEADVILNHYYRYPPRIGNYFGTHFIMGGERFDTPQPEAYLFGENADLNFLGCKPTPFPYPPPQASEPTKTLKSLVNIRKESVRFVKASDGTPKANGDGPKANVYNVEFVFDADARCTVTIHCFCSEEPGANGLNYVPRDAMLSSETFHFKRGVNQVFSAPNYTFNPSLYSEDDLSYNAEKDTFPIVIHCVVDEGTEESRQSHTTICVVDHHSDGTYALRALKQKIYVDGLCYLLQEIYGIENKLINKTLGDEDTDDNGSECVICMCDTRDTLILPCRHLCLCNSCADSLRYQANNCPICRAPFRALLQIRAVQKNYADANPTAPHSPQEGSDNIPSGYLPISLIEALNGPVSRSKPNTSDITTENSVEPITATADKQDALNARPKAATNHETNGSREKLNHSQVDFRMSVLLSKDDGSVACVTKELLSKHSPLMHRAPISRDKNPREKGGLRIPSSQTNSVTVSIAEKDAKDGLAMEKETVHLVNEKNKLPELPENDDDSEAEKLSPLLQKSKEKPTDTARRLNAAMAHGKDEMNGTAQTNASSIMGLLASHDAETNVHPGAEDSDYYTPEDPHTTILSPLKGEEKLDGAKRLATPLSTLKEASQGSLPDSPVSGNSQASTRSSGDSYSSSSSTRQLLSSGVTNDTPTHVVVNLDSSEALISQDIHLSDGKKAKCLESD